jgi:hypothetical protein
MSLQQLSVTAREIVGCLARNECDLLVRRCAKSRLTASDLRAAIRDYGRTLVSPPPDAYQRLDAVQVQDAMVPTWSVRVPLWTEEEGRSDLTLELTITLGSERPSIELDDLHVL